MISILIRILEYFCRSLVAFGPKQRAIGESAKTQETSNFKNTIGSLKRLIGRTLNDPDVEAEKRFLNAKLIDLNGQVGTQVSDRLFLPKSLVFDNILDSNENRSTTSASSKPSQRPS